MSEIPARKRPLRAVRRLDHDAVDVRLDASLLDYGRVSREAGLSSDEAVARLRGLLGEEPPPRFDFHLPSPRVLWMAAGAVLLAGLVWVTLGLLSADSDSEPTASPPATAVTPAAADPGVTGFAEIFVATYLGQAGEGSESVLEPFLTEPVDLLGLAPGRLYVQNVAAVGVEPSAGGWSVTVAAQVLRRIDGGYGDPTLQYYRVEVLPGDRFQSSVVPTQIVSP